MKGPCGATEIKSGAAKGQRMNLNPTEAQKEAGNYQKGHVSVAGMNISIENPKGSKRSGTDADGKVWETTMTMDYGYIRGTTGKDKDHIDIFLASGSAPRDNIYVIDQYNKDGSFDEHKVVYGFADPSFARSAYLNNYSADWAEGRRIEVTETTLDDFKKWAFDGRRKIKPFADYREVKKLTEEAEEFAKSVIGINDAIAETDSVTAAAVNLSEIAPEEKPAEPEKYSSPGDRPGEAAKPEKKSKWVDEEDAEEFERLRNIMRNGLGQLNMGFPPELLYAGGKMSYLMMNIVVPLNRAG